jgi:class 3 adenylate cyclase/tetratricopeptide (TPR) repeat protein
MSVFCTSCGQENDAGAAFCDNCGTSLASGCPNCGTENRPEARFCRHCGTRLAEADAGSRPTSPPERSTSAPSSADGTTAERRLVSVLFSDLVAFTEYAEGRDPELVRDTLTRYFEATRHAIEHHGGHVEKFIGDAVMAAWGAQRANEDDAERAVRAALEVVEAVRNLGEGLEARVGVLTGQAAVTIGATDQGMVAGDLVNTAARLQAVAPPSTVLVGETTMRAASGAIAFEEVGEQTLKGKTAPVPSWRALRIVGDRGGRSRSEGLEPPFVGREVELRLLKDLLHAMRDERRPRLVSITGPAGIGKSRLAWEFEKYLDGIVEDVYWHRGRAPSYGEGVTFWALGEMVRKRAGLLESDGEETTRQRLHDTVAEWVGDEKERAWIEPALLTLLGLEPAPAGGREVLFAAWRTFFERVARRGTTVLLFEDLQWADGGQLDFIDHVMEWAKGVPLLVVTLARPELLERRPGWGTSARSFNAIGLEPLTDANMRELLTGLVPELPDAALAQILARADGIPLYAVETVRMLVADGRLVADGEGTFSPAGDLGELAMPDSLRALVASRLDGLDEADRSLLQDAAVLGKTFSADALAAIYGQDRTELDGRLRALSKRELLEISVDPVSPERGQYGFVQSVIREVAYDTLSRRDRRSRHLAAARFYEGLGEDELAGILSTHYLAAYEASDPGPEADALRIQARLALRGAAERAVALGGFDQATTCLVQALEITDAPAERAPLLERAAEAADMDGRYEEAVRLGQESVAAYEEAGDRSGVARTSAVMGGILADASLLTEAVDFLRPAIEAADRPEDAPYRADMLARLSRAYMRIGEPDLAVARADEALAIAEPLRLTRIVAEAFINKGAALAYAGRLREPWVLLGAAIELSQEAGDIALELRARNNLAATLGAEDGIESMRVAREAYDLSVRYGIGQMSQWIVGAVAWGALFEGEGWDPTLQQLDSELERSRSAADRGRLLAIREMFMVYRGEDVKAVRTERLRLDSATSDPDVETWKLLMPAAEALFGGDAPTAVSRYREALPLTSQNSIDVRLGLIFAAHLARDLGASREALQAMREERVQGIFVDGAIHLAEAGIAALEGRSTEARDGYDQTIDLWRRNGAHLFVALAQLDALHLLPGERDLEGWAAEARARFEGVEAPPLLALLDAVMAAREGTPAARTRTGEPADRPLG